MNDEAAAQLIPRFQQSGLLLDANLLLVFVAGLHNLAWIGSRPRVKEYTANDLTRLHTFVGLFNRVVTTPNILTEVSNLSNAMVYDRERAAYARTFGTVVAALAERYPRSQDVMQIPPFASLGLTDASIEQVARRRHVFVLSADFDLVRRLHDEGLPALNFNHLRDPAR